MNHELKAAVDAMLDSLMPSIVALLRESIAKKAFVSAYGKVFEKDDWKTLSLEQVMKRCADYDLGQSLYGDGTGTPSANFVVSI